MKKKYNKRKKANWDWSLRKLVDYYKWLLRNGRINIGGAAHSRMVYLETRYLTDKRGDGI